MANNNPDWKCPSCGRWHGPFRFALKCGVCDVALVKKEQKLTPDQIADLEEATARRALDHAIRACDEHARLAWAIGDKEGQSSVCSTGRNYGACACGQAIRAIDPAQFRSARSE